MRTTLSLTTVIALGLAAFMTFSQAQNAEPPPETSEPALGGSPTDAPTAGGFGSLEPQPAPRAPQLEAAEARRATLEALRAAEAQLRIAQQRAAEAQQRADEAEGNALSQDLTLLQGKWELFHGNEGKGPPTIRSVKEVSGNRETLRRYDIASNNLLREHSVEFTLSTSGNVRVFTFYGVGGVPTQGQSFVYKVDADSFYDIPGLLQGENYRNYQESPTIWHWKRVKEAEAGADAVESPRPGDTSASSAQQATFFTQPEHVKAVLKSSPRFNDRVFIYRAEPISTAILNHNVGAKEVVLGVVREDGVRFGHAFSICVPESEECVGVAKVLELEKGRCIAKVVSIDKDKAEKSLKGFSAVCAAPKRNVVKTAAIEIGVGKNVWQTESLENKIIQGLLETGDDQTQILIRQESSDK